MFAPESGALLALSITTLQLNFRVSTVTYVRPFSLNKLLSKLVESLKVVACVRYGAWRESCRGEGAW